jgi:hypothetical protein
VPTDPKTIALTYFNSWKEKDFEELRSVLADEVTFSGPMGTADGADDCLKGLKVRRRRWRTSRFSRCSRMNPTS